MLNLGTLRQLLSEPALRQQVSRLITNKVRADVKSLETSALLSRHLTELAARSGDGDAAAHALQLAIKEHLDYYETLVNQTLAFNARLLDQLRGVTGPSKPASGPVVMNLAAPPGVTVRAPFHLENNKTTPISVGFEVTPFASEDGAQLIPAEVGFDPPAFDLRPGQEEKIELIVSVDDRFRPNAVYFATLTVTGLEATQLLIKLRVETAPTVQQIKPLSSAPDNEARLANKAKVGPSKQTSPHRRKAKRSARARQRRKST